MMMFLMELTVSCLRLILRLTREGASVKDHNTCNRTLRGMDELFHRLFPNPAKREKERRSLLAKGINRGAETKDLKYCLTTKSNYYGR